MEVESEVQAILRAVRNEQDVLDGVERLMEILAGLTRGAGPVPPGG